MEAVRLVAYMGMECTVITQDQLQGKPKNKGVVNNSQTRQTNCTWVWNTSTPPWANHGASPNINTWTTTAWSSRQVQSKYGCGTHQHHPGSTTCATIKVWSPTVCSCIPAQKHKRVWNTTSSPWADHNARPAINVWSTADSACRQVQSIPRCGTHQHHPGPTTCASPTINVWSPIMHIMHTGSKT